MASDEWRLKRINLTVVINKSILAETNSNEVVYIFSFTIAVIKYELNKYKWYYKVLRLRLANSNQMIQLLLSVSSIADFQHHLQTRFIYYVIIYIQYIPAQYLRYNKTGANLNEGVKLLHFISRLINWWIKKLSILFVSLAIWKLWSVSGNLIYSSPLTLV